MLPGFSLDGACMFIPSHLVVPGGLADVCRFVRTGAGVFVDAFFFIWVWVGFVAAAENVL